LDALRDDRVLGSKRLRTATDAITAMASTGAAASAAENMGAYAQSSFQDNKTIITDATAMWTNLQMVSVFFLGLFLGMVFLYWMLFGTAATAAPFFRFCNCLPCFRRQQPKGIGKGKGKGFGRNMTNWSDPPTAFQIENLEPDRAIGPARALAKSKGKYKGKYALKGGRGNVYMATSHER